MDINSNSFLYTMIGADEKPLWQGKPDKLCFILESIFNPLLPFAILWASVDFGIIGGLHIMAKNSQQTGIPILFLVSFFALHLMPVWMYLAGVLLSFLKYKNTEFLITNKAVYVSGGVFSVTYEQKPFTELSHTNLHRGIFDQMLGVGDVSLTSNHDGYNTREGHSLYRGITICDISDYQSVYSLVKKLQEDVYTDTMYPNDLRPKENHGYKTEYKG